MDIRRTDLDGLATFWADAAPGPAQAWLVFRAGAADETLFTRGITRLVAALAIDDLDTGEAAYGHFVGGPTTAIELNGTPELVASILREVCAALAAGGTERLEPVRERELLRSGWRVDGGEDGFLAIRFGPHGAGLSGQPELGLHHLGGREVDAWRTRFFTVENASLSLKNVSPDDLRLPPLPHGAPRPLPAPSPRPLPFPAWFEGPGDGVAVSSVLPGTGAADAFTTSAVRRLRARLPAGGQHRAGVLAVRMWPRLDHVVVHSSAPGRSAAQVRDAVLSVVDELAADGADDAEIDERHRELRRWADDPASLPARLEWAAHRHVLDPRDVPGEPERPERAAVAAAAREFAGAALYSVPRDVGMPLPYTRLPQSSEDAVSGGTVARTADGSIAVADDGVTVTLDGRRVTVWFDRCEAVARWPDGTLDLYGSDGFGAQIRPQRWPGGHALVAGIAERLKDVTIVMRRPPPGP